MAASKNELTARALAAKAKAEKEEDARWARCSGCDMTRRLTVADDVKVIVEHNMYDGHEMTWCRGSGLPPQTVPEAVFTDDAPE